MMHAEVPQRVDDRVGDCRRSANGAALSGTFDAKRVVSSWGFLEIKCERRQHIRPRHRVVHIGPGKELARFRIVGAVLEESLADSDRKSTRLTPVTNAQLVFRLLLKKKKTI